MRFNLHVLCCHLRGKGWPLGSRLWCLVCHFPIGILGQVWYLNVSISDLCTLTYFNAARMTVFTPFEFQFCPLSYHFCTKTNTNKIEKKKKKKKKKKHTQERTLKFVYDDYTSSYIDLLIKASLPTFGTRRVRTMAIENFEWFSFACYLRSFINQEENKCNLDALIFYRYHKCGIRCMVRNRSNMRLLCCGSLYLMNLIQLLNFNKFNYFISHWTGENCKCIACMAVPWYF